MRRLGFIFLIGVLVLVLSSQTGLASQPQVPKKDINMSLDFSGQPESGNEFTITLSFTPLEEIKHKNNLPDRARILFPEGVELVSGNNEWEGYLIEGVTHTIQIVAKATKPGFYMISGLVQSCQIDVSLVPKSPKVPDKIAKKVYSRMYRYHNPISKYFRFGEEEEPIYSNNTKYPQMDSSKGVISRPIFIKEEWGEREVMGYEFKLNRDVLSAKNKHVQVVGTIKLRKGEPAVVFLYETSEDNIVDAEFEVKEDCCDIRKLSSGIVELTVLKSEGTCDIIASYKGHTYIIKIILI